MVLFCKKYAAVVAATVVFLLVCAYVPTPHTVYSSRTSSSVARRLVASTKRTLGASRSAAFPKSLVLAAHAKATVDTCLLLMGEADARRVTGTNIEYLRDQATRNLDDQLQGHRDKRARAKARAADRP